MYINKASAFPMAHGYFQECILGGGLGVRKEGIQKQTAKVYFIQEKLTLYNQRLEQKKMLNFQLLRILQDCPSSLERRKHGIFKA